MKSRLHLLTTEPGLRSFLPLALLAAFSAALFTPAVSGGEAGQAPDIPSLDMEFLPIRPLKEEINILNLLNALDLSREQMKKILGLATRARALQMGHFDGSDPVLGRGRKAFGDLLQYLRKGEPAPRDIELQAEAADAELSRRRRQYFGRLNSLEKEAEQVLSEGQRRLVAGYRECLIPETDLKNPVRVGQAQSGVIFGDLIDQACRLPEEEAETGTRKIVEAVFGFLGKKFNLSALNVEAEKERMRGVLLKARALSPSDRELRKAELAGELKPRFIGDLHQEADVFMGKIARVAGGVGKIGKQLLSARVIPILELRLSNPEAFSTKPPEDSDEKRALLSNLNSAGKVAPTVAQISQYLKLEGKERETFEQRLIKFQKEALTVLMTRNSQGVSPLAVILAGGPSLAGEEPGASFFNLLLDPMPGKECSYQEELIRLKLEALNDLRGVIEKGKFLRFTGLNLDMIDIKTGFSGPLGLGRDRQSTAGQGGDSPSFLAVCRTLGLDPRNSEPFRQLLIAHQKNLIGLFKNGAPGNTPLESLARMVSDPGDITLRAAFFQSLQEKVASESSTYLEKIMEADRVTLEGIQGLLPPEVFDRFRALNLDLMKIQAGFNALANIEYSLDDLEYQEKKDSVRNRFGIGARASLEEIFSALNLHDSVLQGKFRGIIQSCQKDAFNLLSQPGEDGKVPVDQLATLAKNPKGRGTFFLSLMKKVKGSSETFIQGIESVKKKVNLELEKILGKNEFHLFRSFNLEILDIDSGYNPGFELMKRRVKGWF